MVVSENLLWVSEQFLWHWRLFLPPLWHWLTQSPQPGRTGLLGIICPFLAPNYPWISMFSMVILLICFVFLSKGEKWCGEVLVDTKVSEISASCRGQTCWLWWGGGLLTMLTLWLWQSHYNRSGPTSHGLSD